MEKVEDHIGLASYVARLYLPDNAIVEDTEEYAEALIGIWEASQTFDPDRGVDFAGYAQTKARWRINNLRQNRKNEFHAGMSQLDSTSREGQPSGPQTDCMVSDVEDPADAAEHLDWFDAHRDKVTALLPRLSEPQRTAIHGVLQGKRFWEIAEELEVSKQAVNNAYRRGIRELNNMMGKEA